MANEIKLLFAEDDELMRKSIARFLVNSGFAVTEVADGAEAVDKAKQQPFDLFICDINMPIMSGMEAIEIMRKELKLSMPILVLTVLGTEKTELESFAIGATEFMSKPFSPSVLKTRIEKIVNGKL